MLKIAVVGTGIIGISHIEAIKQLPDCKLCALCDLDESKVKPLAEENNVPYFLNYEDIPSSIDCDAVILNLPHGLHCKSSVFFLDHGMHVLVEKPMANTVAECEEMIAAANRNNKKLAVAHIQRFFTANTIVKKTIESGELGKLCMYTEARTVNYFDEKRPRWFLDKKIAGGGIVMNYGAHAFDKLFFTTGARPSFINASSANIKNDASIEGHAQIFARFNNGLTAAITFSGYSKIIYDSIYYFTDGAMRVIGSDILEINRGDDNGWVRIPSLNDGLEFVREIDEFRKYTEGMPSLIPDAQYGKDIIAAIEQVYLNH